MLEQLRDKLKQNYPDLYYNNFTLKIVEGIVTFKADGEVIPLGTNYEQCLVTLEKMAADVQIELENDYALDDDDLDEGYDYSNQSDLWE